LLALSSDADAWMSAHVKESLARLQQNVSSIDTVRSCEALLLKEPASAHESIDRVENASFAIFRLCIAPLHILRQLIQNKPTTMQKRSHRIDVDLVFANRFSIDPQSLIVSCLEAIKSIEADQQDAVALHLLEKLLKHRNFWFHFNFLCLSEHAAKGRAYCLLNDALLLCQLAHEKL
jgi:hypothetical protein